MCKTFLGLIALVAAMLRFDGSGVLRVRSIRLLIVLLLARARRFLRPISIGATVLRLDHHLVHVLHTLSETFSLFESTLA